MKQEVSRVAYRFQTVHYELLGLQRERERETNHNTSQQRMGGVLAQQAEFGRLVFMHLEKLSFPPTHSILLLFVGSLQTFKPGTECQ